MDTQLADNVRRCILEASVRAPEPWHVDAVLTAYGSQDPTWKLTAVSCMRSIRGFDTQICEALDGADPEMVHAALVIVSATEGK